LAAVTLKSGDLKHPRSRGLRRAAVAVCAVLAVLAAGCGGGHAKGGHGGASASDVQVSITPANGGVDRNPGKGITVTAAKGSITNVTVKAGGDPVSGSL